MNMNVSLDQRDVGPLSLAPLESVFPESGTRGHTECQQNSFQTSKAVK